MNHNPINGSKSILDHNLKMDHNPRTDQNPKMDQNPRNGSKSKNPKRISFRQIE